MLLSIAIIRCSLGSKELETINIQKSTVEEIESALIKEHAGKSKVFAVEKETELIKKLIDAFSIEKGEGERQADFDKRVIAKVGDLVEN